MEGVSLNLCLSGENNVLCSYQLHSPSIACLQQVMFIKAVLNTTVYGPRVHTTFLLKKSSADQTDGGEEEEQPTTHYQHIANCNSEVSATMHIV